MEYIIYCDGSCKGNQNADKIGGWGYAIYQSNSYDPIYYNAGAVPGVTNNQMELTAMIEGIDYLINNFNDIDMVTICSDSAYICNCWKDRWYENWQKNGWKTSTKKPVLNQTFWEALIPYFNDSRFWWKKVKGHSTNEKNNFVDELAQKSAKDYLMKRREYSC